jgi:hypothetical protein
VLLDDDARPDRVEQLLLRQQLPWPLDKVQESVEQPRRQRDRVTVWSEQHSALGIQAEALESINRLGNRFVHSNHPALQMAVSLVTGAMAL